MTSTVPEPVDENPANNGDQESILETELGSSTQSLSSSIINYRNENGRTYHRYKDGKYSLPNDAEEIERLDLQHHIFLMTFYDRLGLSPPNSPDYKASHVLDIGTGTGIWAIEYADEHPEAHVVGVDLSPIQPSYVPPNVEFFVDDVEEEWTYSQKFDYIHSRFMTSSIASWPVFLRRIFDNLTPGGYVELQEADVLVKSDDGTLKEDHALNKCLQLLLDASVKLGRGYQDIKYLKDLMIEIGFVDVVLTPFKWPINDWPKDKRLKDMGAWNRINMTSGLEGFAMAPLTRALGWERDEVSVFLVDVRKDLADRSIHAYWPIYAIYGRKPSA